MTNHDGGKGDAPRPLGVPMDKFDAQWEQIFGKKPAKQEQEKQNDNSKGSA